MNRKTFFKSIAALGVAVGIVPKVLAEKKQEGHVFNVEVLENRLREIENNRCDFTEKREFNGSNIVESGLGRFTMQIDVNAGSSGDLVIDENGNQFYVYQKWYGPTVKELRIAGLDTNTPSPKEGRFVVYRHYHPEAL